MNEIYNWWDDAVAAANTIARDTKLRHRVTAVRDQVEGVEQIVGWHVDLADGEHLRAATEVEFWDIVSRIAPTTTGAAR